MEITLMDFCLINFVSYIFGLGSGLIICCKNKDKLLVKSRSLDNISQQRQPQLPYISPVLASAPTTDKAPVKITVE